MSTSNFKVQSGDSVVLTTQYFPAKKYVTFTWQNQTAPRKKTYALKVSGKLDRTSGTSPVAGHIANYYDGTAAEAIDERPGDGAYRNRTHSATHWINVFVGTGYSDALAIRSQAHDWLTMTNGQNSTTSLDHPKAVSGYASRFDMIWDLCGSAN